MADSPRNGAPFPQHDAPGTQYAPNNGPQGKMRQALPSSMAAPGDPGWGSGATGNGAYDQPGGPSGEWGYANGQPTYTDPSAPGDSATSWNNDNGAAAPGGPSGEPASGQSSGSCPKCSKSSTAVARGGGKTESRSATGSTICSDPSGIRRSERHRHLRPAETHQLAEVIARTKQLFSKLGAKYNEQQKTWTMANGARLKFVYLEKDSDAEEYQGHSYTRVYMEEVTNFPTSGPIDKLRATLRSGAGVPVGMRLTGNPGGAGHNWVKKRYIDPAPEATRSSRSHPDRVHRP
jgi:hypothetical protein